MFWKTARENTPPVYRKPNSGFTPKTGETDQAVRFQGLALVEHLLALGLKQEAVRAYRKLQGAHHG